MITMLKKSNLRAVYIWLSLLSVIYLPSLSFAQLAKGRSEFVGNIIGSGSIPSDFTQYWNQVTPENAGKRGRIL